MKLVTVATRSEDYFPVLQDGAARLGYDLVVLGWGQRWRGFAWRWSLLKAYLTTVPPDEVVVWCDAYDVFPVATPETVETRFRAFRKPMVMSVEASDVPVAEIYIRRRMFGKSCRPGVFINGGLYMGYARTLAAMIGVLETQVGVRDSDDDQRLLNRLCRTQFMRHVAFDLESRIFFNAHAKDIERNIRPVDTCFIHGPGHVDLRGFARAYGYTPPKYHSRFKPEYMRRWCNQFLPVLYPELLVIIVVIFMAAYAVFRRATKK